MYIELFLRQIFKAYYVNADLKVARAFHSSTTNHVACHKSLKLMQKKYQVPS